jgi:hypothetical protein
VPVTPASSAATCLMRYENQKLEGLTFDLDDDEIIGCHLVDCRIWKRLPIFSDSHSKGCDFEFSKSALVTIQTGGLQHARRSDRGDTHTAEGLPLLAEEERPRDAGEDDGCMIATPSKSAATLDLPVLLQMRLP